MPQEPPVPCAVMLAPGPLVMPLVKEETVSTKMPAASGTTAPFIVAAIEPVLVMPPAKVPTLVALIPIAQLAKFNPVDDTVIEPPLLMLPANVVRPRKPSTWMPIPWSLKLWGSLRLWPPRLMDPVLMMLPVNERLSIRNPILASLKLP